MGRWATRAENLCRGAGSALEATLNNTHTDRWADCSHCTLGCGYVGCWWGQLGLDLGNVAVAEHSALVRNRSLDWQGKLPSCHSVTWAKKDGLPLFPQVRYTHASSPVPSAGLVFLGFVTGQGICTRWFSFLLLEVCVFSCLAWWQSLLGSWHLVGS